MSAEQAAERITLRRDTRPSGPRFGAFVRRAWKRRWVKVLAVLLALPFIAYFILWLIFARDLPSAEALLNYEPVLPTYVRDINGEPVQSFARERRVQLAYDEFPAQLINAFLAAEDRTFFSHGGIDFPGIVSRDVRPISTSSGRPVGGSTITQQVAKNLLLDQRGRYTRKIRELFLARRHRIGADQGADPRALPQPDLPRPERLWRAGGGARLFRQGRRRADPRRIRLSRDPAQGADQLRPGPPARAGARAAQLGARRDGAQRLHHRRPARRGAAASRSARCAAAARASATSAAISWRRSAAP